MFDAFLVVSLFLCGKSASWLIYRMCWTAMTPWDLSVDGGRRFRSSWWPSVATSIFFRRWRWVPVHVAILFLLSSTSWEQHLIARQTTSVMVSILAFGAVFRFGSVDRHCFFWADRIVAIAMAIASIGEPVFVYPSLVVSSGLQYSNAGWELGSGYSNLLGFEFIRGSLSAVMVWLIGIGLTNTLGFSAVAGCDERDLSSAFLPLLLCFQASHYVNHGLAKAFLGRRWYSWALENRVECLFVNSYLRGWRAGRSVDSVLRLAGRIRQFRVPICFGILILETGFLLVLTDPSVALILVCAMVLFHVVTFHFSGLLAWEYVVNHLALAAFVFFPVGDAPAKAFGAPLALATGVVMMVAFVWAGFLRRRMLTQYRTTGTSAAARYADPFDHMMAWWDSPYMRMYSYIVTTPDGERLRVPVDKLSPYDTFLTDIHTHIMILNQHPDWDLTAETDKGVARCGVWGLLVDESDRDRMYKLMDAVSPNLTVLQPKAKEAHFPITGGCGSSPGANGLHRMCVAINHYISRRWFRFVMRYPHFPGEDLVPDICPLSGGDLERYRFDRPIESVEIECVKTFVRPEEIRLVDQKTIGMIELRWGAGTNKSELTK